MLLTMSFLTTRVKDPDQDDWSKLLRLLGYLKSTMEFNLKLSCKNINTLTWYVDELHTSHQYMKG
jgi:hypothetical protein